MSLSEVFLVYGGSYSFSKTNAASVCNSVGAVLATAAQVDAAFSRGADWCCFAHVADGGDRFPATTSLSVGCGGAKPGVRVASDVLAGATCYGRKPQKSLVSTVGAFSAQRWSDPLIDVLLSISSSIDQKSNAPSEVFLVSVSTSYVLSFAEASSVCSFLGATVSTYDQLQSAKTSGADWCELGYISDQRTGYPISTSVSSKCGVFPVVQVGSLKSGSTTCFGKKPSKGAKNVVPFSSLTWNDPSVAAYFFGEQIKASITSCM